MEVAGSLQRCLYLGLSDLRDFGRCTSSEWYVNFQSCKVGLCYRTRGRLSVNGAVDIHLFILCATHYIMVLLNRAEGNSGPSCGEKSDPIGGLCDTDFVPIFG